jgi:OmpA-OmpF porin, OOP family
MVVAISATYYLFIGEIMKKVNCLILAIATMITTSASAEGVVNNWKNANGDVWKSASGECWRNAEWTPETAAVNCGGALKAPEPAPIPKPVAAPVVVSPPAPPPVVEAVATKITLQADALFNFDSSALKPAGKEALDNLATKVKDVHLEAFVATGYTDWTGSIEYNKKLSLNRAESVKTYLVGKGLPADKIFVEGKGKSHFVASNSTKEGRAKNRRVDIEVVGTTMIKNNATAN